MIKWLKLTDNQRKTSMEQASFQSGIIAKAIEKDWWVTLTLKVLFQTAYAENLVFKGGTSLSKCGLGKLNYYHQLKSRYFFILLRHYFFNYFLFFS